MVIGPMGATAALVSLDPSEGGYFRRTQTFRGFNNVFSGNVTGIGTGAVPASLYALGLIRKDSKMQHTALLAGEAMANAAILTSVLKDVTKRIKPAGFPVSANQSDSWFKNKAGSPYSYIRGNGSFPSGHDIETIDGCLTQPMAWPRLSGFHAFHCLFISCPMSSWVLRLAIQLVASLYCGNNCGPWNLTVF